MDRNSLYYRQVQLLIRLLPLIAPETRFALKGGTAINLFVRAFPRLSVDIDLAYLPVNDHATAIMDISAALERLARNIEQALHGAQVDRSFRNRADALRLTIAHAGATVKIELSPVLRGTVYVPQTRAVVREVESEFGFAEIPVVAFEDLYAGKICAALDRQHPRDWFDTRLLLDNEGLSESLKKEMLVYLVSHGRPIEELLAPRFKDIDQIYRNEFAGMTRMDIALQDLLDTRQRLIAEIHAGLNDGDKAFLCSLYEQQPQWSHLGIKGIEALPAVQWKLLNIDKMSPAKRESALLRLQQVLRH
jgi:predicted nucleotidyltransferase component of viral defense system